MSNWKAQLTTLIAPALARSEATEALEIGRGTLARVGSVAAQVTDKRKALVLADTAGFTAAGAPVVASLVHAGFEVSQLVLPETPLPKASTDEAEPFRAALAEDPALFPVSVGSGVINDLVKYAAFRTNQRYMSVATAASMDGYTSAGAPLAKDGFKITIATRAPIALVADLDVLCAAPVEMTAWGFGDLSGKMPAGGDWIIADALGVEALDNTAWPLVQDHLAAWLDHSAGIAQGDLDAVAGLFVGLTAVGFAMEFHGSSRPASGADHQIAHMWEMDGHSHLGRKVSHGAAVSVGCVAVLTLFDWLLTQDLTQLDIDDILSAAPGLDDRCAVLRDVIGDPKIAEKAEAELGAKHAEPSLHRARLERLVTGWPQLQLRLSQHLLRAKDMTTKLQTAGAPVLPSDIGIEAQYFLRTLRAAGFIRSRYTILDLLHETGLSEIAFAAVLPQLSAAVRVVSR